MGTGLSAEAPKEAFLTQEHGGAGFVIVNRPITADVEFEWVCDPPCKPVCD